MKNANFSPIYYQVYKDIYQKIVDGSYKLNEFLPYEKNLIEMYGVSRNVIRAALNKLAMEGYIEKTQGRGTIVKSVPVTADTKIKYNNVIAVLIVDINMEFFASLARSIEQAAYKEDFRVIMCYTDNDSDKEGEYLKKLLNSVAGFVVIPASDNKNQQYYGKLLAEKIPFVFVDRYLPEFNVDHVTSDNKQGGYLAAKHLLERGHKKIGVIVDPPVTSTFDRLAGYKQALQEFNIDYNPELVMINETMDLSRYDSFGYSAAKNLLSLPDKPTAIFCTNDMTAKGAIEYLMKEKTENVHIVGFDDTPIASYLNPPLTTVKQNTSEMGKTAVELLIKKIRSNNIKTEAQKIVIPVNLVIRS
jgi:DNA-binding LacI/PurR family transcriptional regulator